MIANIIADHFCPTYVALTGIRYYLHRYLRIPFQRSRAVYRLADGAFVCNPDTVPVLTTYLRAQGLECRVQPKLEIAK